MRANLRILLGIMSAFVPVAALAGDWTQFRGTYNTGVADEKVPAEWSQDANVQWKIKIPGVAWSSPIVSGDKVFVTTAITKNQQRPSGGYAGPGAGGPPGRRGGPGGRGERGPGGGGPPRFALPRPGEVIPAFLQQRLNLSDEQKQALGQLQKEVDDQLAQLLTAGQAKQFQDPQQSGRGPRGRFARPQPGQIIPPQTQESLELTGQQKQRLDALQKDVDGKIAGLLTEDQNQQLREMRDGPGRGRRGPGGRGFGRGDPPDDVYRWEVYCIDRTTGETLWKQLALEGKPRIAIQRSNTYATETPVTDGERVYAYFAMHGLFCYDFSGNLVWSKDLGSYSTAAGWGTASSPVLEGDRLFVLCDNEEDSFLVALDKMTGDELWRVSRTEQTTYSTPVVWRNKVRTELVTLGSLKMRSYDPATGEQLWELTVGDGQCSASPVGDAEMLYAGLRNRGGGSRGGRPGGPRGGDSGGSTASGLFAVRAGASGDLDSDDDSSTAGLVWNSPRSGPEMASPLVYQGYLYLLSQSGGIITCLDARTGEQVYRNRLPGAKAFWSSPWAADDKIFCLDDGGTTYVVQRGPEFKLLGQNNLDEMFWSSAAVADGALYLRSVDHLYCIRE